MRRMIARAAAIHFFVCYMAVVSALCVSTGEAVKLEGFVLSQHDDIVTVRSKDHGDVEVRTTEFTKIAMPKGLLRKKQMSSTDIVPGLWVKVKGLGNSPGRVLAQTITFSEHDYRTAAAIQAGNIPLNLRVQDNEQQIHANAQSIQAHEDAIQFNSKHIEANRQELERLNQRFAKLPELDVKYAAHVHFPVGSSTLTPRAKSELMEFARNALPLKEYRIQVRGFTDATGASEMNQELSMRRAQSVIAFLEQSGNIPVRKVLAPGAMGQSHPASSNATPEGRDENRRAEVQLLVSRAFSY